MRNHRWLIGLLCVAFSAGVSAQTSTSIVDQLQAQRQKFAQDATVDPQQLSHAIQAAVSDSMALDQAGNDAEAINKLLSLQKYAPLEQLPDHDVQMLCARFYTKLGNTPEAEGCRERAAAMAEILQKRSGSGATVDDPVRVVTIGEIGEWVRLQSATITDVQGLSYHGANLQKITYSSPAIEGKPVAYFLINPRVLASVNRTRPGVFDPQPVSASDGKYFVALKQAHEQRTRFLADRSFNYPELIQLCRESMKQAAQLAQQGDINGALSRMKDVEKIRPIREIPIFNFISVYSALLGKAGDVEAQADMRIYLFGIAQDIAHSGDGLSPDSAVHVVAIEEEYAWVADKKLRVTKQGLIRQGDSRYDALETTDANGKAQTFYFEVSQVFARGSPF